LDPGGLGDEKVKKTGFFGAFPGEPTDGLCPFGLPGDGWGDWGPGNGSGKIPCVLLNPAAGADGGGGPGRGLPQPKGEGGVGPKTFTGGGTLTAGGGGKYAGFFSGGGAGGWARGGRAFQGPGVFSGWGGGLRHGKAVARRNKPGGGPPPSPRLENPLLALPGTAGRGGRGRVTHRVFRPARSSVSKKGGGEGSAGAGLGGRRPVFKRRVGKTFPPDPGARTPP